MGTFTNVDSVKSLFRRIKIAADTGDERTNTVVTIEEVDEFIDETEATVKAKLSTCYDVTTIGSESTVIIGKVVKYFVADTIADILRLTSGTSSERKDQMVGPNWAKKAAKMLEDICPEQDCDKCRKKPVIPLPDTDLLPEAPVGASLFNSASNEAKFKKVGNNW